MFKSVIQTILRKSLKNQLNSNVINKSRIIHTSIKVSNKDEKPSDIFFEKQQIYKKWQVDQVKDILESVEKGKYNLGESDLATDVVFDTDEEQLLEEEGVLIKPSFATQHEHKYERGKRGVFDIEQIIEVVRAEKAIDIAVIEVPPEMQYCDYMIIMCPKSARHGLSMAENLNKIYKRTKNKSDRFLRIHKRDKDWIAIDMINIVIHIMANRLREDFDIESLWALGEEFDPQLKKAAMEADSLIVG